MKLFDGIIKYNPKHAIIKTNQGEFNIPYSLLL